MLKAIKHQSGKRTFHVGGMPASIAERVSSLARSETAKIKPTSARDILKGECRKGWALQDMQRQRYNMEIRYTLTPEGQAYRVRDNLLARFLDWCEIGEASDVSEAMLGAGFSKFNRQRVLISGAAAIEKGLVTIRKHSGKIGA